MKKRKEKIWILLNLKKHNVNTIKVNKICLSCFDNKKYLLNDGITSYAYGHYKIKEYEKN